MWRSRHLQGFSSRLRARTRTVLRAFGIAAALGLAASPAHAERMGMLAPGYQYPTLGTLWADLAAAAARVPLIAVLNPASGPGTQADPVYVAAGNAVRAQGGRVIGYVATFGGDAPLDSVVRQVDRYRAWYALDGIFLDIMANDASGAHVAYYAAIRDSIRARRSDWLVVGNPGTQTLEPYLAGADVLCNFEYFGEGYFSFAPSPWVRAWPPSRFAHLLHSLSTADSMRAAIARARTANAAWVWVTHDTMPNPYAHTPAYWNELIAAVETTTVTAAPPAVPGAAALAAWPVPARGRVTFAPPAGRPDAAVLVLDTAGRVVRTLAGVGERAWDGTDPAGRRVPPGVYFARTAGSAGRAIRLVMLE